MKGMTLFVLLAVFFAAASAQVRNGERERKIITPPSQSCYADHAVLSPIRTLYKLTRPEGLFFDRPGRIRNKKKKKKRKKKKREKKERSSTHPLN
jgi:hypothetical protein